MLVLPVRCRQTALPASATLHCFHVASVGSATIICHERRCFFGFLPSTFVPVPLLPLLSVPLSAPLPSPLQLLSALETYGGEDAFVNIKYLVPTWCSVGHPGAAAAASGHGHGHGHGGAAGGAGAPGSR